MNRKHIRIELAPGVWARVAADVSKETLALLGRLLEAVRKQFGEPITCHTSEASVTCDPLMHDFWRVDEKEVLS